MNELRETERPPEAAPAVWRAEETGEPGEPEEPGDSASSSGAYDASEPEDEGEPAEPEGDIPLQGAFLDRVKSVFGGKADEVKEISEVVDQPDFQVPGRLDPPDRYGTPLERPDGTRTPLFDGEPRREQTKQGELGDCGVIATLGAVAGHRPLDIQDAVRENEDGTYEVRLHAAKNAGMGRYEPTGDVIKLTVTPDLPVHDEIPGMPAFADSVSTGAAWAPVLEKAIAGADQTWTEERGDHWKRAHNVQGELPTGYVRLDAGTKSFDRAELMVQLTGQPAETFDLPTGYNYAGQSPKQQVMSHFTEKLADDCPIVVGTRKPKPDEQPLPKDLIGGHAYEITEVDDRGLIHLRNPHNKTHPEPLTFDEFRKSCLPFYTTLEPK
ncbi:hypothetical protein [Streptomyces puniciscabiei]|uniref:hypothetical protein n=1 Tax=Streptomyces puniciscabiei TaxID=164348 RepID=UPI00331E0C3A